MDMESTFKSARGLALATVILLGGQALLLGIESVGWWAIGSMARGESRMLFAASLVSVMAFRVLLLLASAVLFSTWIYRAMANLPALGSHSSRFTPSAAVWAFFIPFVNLVRGHQVMATIWSESQPPAMTDAGFLKPPSIAIVNWWWALWIGGNVLEYVCSKAFDDFSSLAQSQAIFSATHAAAAILCAIMVRRADARQKEQWIDLERRAGVPQPTGAELR